MKETDETVEDTMGGRGGGMESGEKKGGREDRFQGFVHRMSLSLSDSV